MIFHNAFHIWVHNPQISLCTMKATCPKETIYHLLRKSFLDFYFDARRHQYPNFWQNFEREYLNPGYTPAMNVFW